MAAARSRLFIVHFPAASTGEPRARRVGASSPEQATAEASRLAGYEVEPTAIYQSTAAGWERVS